MRIPSTPLATRATPITADNKSTAVTIATWLLMITFLIMFLSREAIKFVVVRKFSLDDLLILLATIFAVGLSATTLILASHGLGVLEEITLRRANILMKGYYASDFLYVLSICFAKLSLVTFFYSILVQRAQRRVVQLLGLFIATWTLASLFVVAFQCGLPKPWEMMTLHCYNSGVFWIVYCIIDMSTDLSIIMLSVNLVAYLQVKFSRKLIVVACFAPRLLVMGAALARLIYVFPVTPHNNPAFNLWIPVICTQLQVCLSISTACIPYMKPFFEGVESGVWRADDLRRKGMSVHDLYAYGRTGTSTKSHRRGKGFHSFDSTAVPSVRYGPTPDVSPRIPTPVPLSPILPPRLLTPPNSNVNSLRSPSERGLRLNIPTLEIRPATEVISPQTASSYALSPECLSPQPLLSPTSPSSPIRTPTPPSRVHSPQPNASSSHSSPDPNGKSPQASHLALFQQRPSVRYSLIPPISKTPSPSIPQPPFVPRSNNRRKRISVHRMPPNTSQPRSPTPETQFPPRTSSRAPMPHPVPRATYANIPGPQNSGPSPTLASSSHTNAPATQSIASPPYNVPSYYMRTPSMETPATFSIPAPSSPRLRNQRILTPQNSSRVDQISPVSPKSQPLTFWRDESSDSAGTSSAGPSAGSAWRAERPWEREPMPIVRDLRSSPRIIIQRSP